MSLNTIYDEREPLLKRKLVTLLTIMLNNLFFSIKANNHQ